MNVVCMGLKLVWGVYGWIFSKPQLKELLIAYVCTSANSIDFINKSITYKKVISTPNEHRVQICFMVTRSLIGNRKKQNLKMTR